MRSYIWETPDEINLALAQRIKGIRQRRGLSQTALSKKSGVSYSSLKRFETTGQISLLSLTRIAVALGCTDQIRMLFTDVPYLTIDEVVNEKSTN